MNKRYWRPISRERLIALIEDAEIEMETEIKYFWDSIKIMPEKWQLSPVSDEGRGFWVVAIIGQNCIYYNDIEEGFNLSRYNQYGKIANYYSNQATLLNFINGYYVELLKNSLPNNLRLCQ